MPEDKITKNDEKDRLLSRREILIKLGKYSYIAALVLATQSSFMLGCGGGSSYSDSISYADSTIDSNTIDTDSEVIKAGKSEETAPLLEIGDQFECMITSENCGYFKLGIDEPKSTLDVIIESVSDEIVVSLRDTESYLTEQYINSPKTVSFQFDESGTYYLHFYCYNLQCSTAVKGNLTEGSQSYSDYSDWNNTYSDYSDWSNTYSDYSDWSNWFDYNDTGWYDYNDIGYWVNWINSW